MNRVLIIEDELSMRLGLKFTLEDAGYKVDTAEDGTEGIACILKTAYDIIITDYRLPGHNGIEILGHIKKHQHDCCVIMITAYAEIETAVNAVKLGAFDYIQKPFEPTLLLDIIERFAAQTGKTSCGADPQDAEEGFFGIIGNSREIQKVFNFVHAVAKTDSSVMLYGESGTGKELVANAIHYLSSRKDKNIVRINSATIPEDLLEAELCGYEKGAFTGAFQQKKGKLEIAHEGTFFFDEIGDMPLHVQTKLLRIIENKSFERLGGNTEITIDTRFIFATRMNIPEMIAKGDFREDLYYRINVLSVTLPPLRDRRDDAAAIAKYYAVHFSRKQSRAVPSFSADFCEFLDVYDFPGNVRELKHIMENAVTFCPGEEISLDCLPDSVLLKYSPEEEHNACLLDSSVKEAEKHTILGALESFSGRKSDAAAFLGISRVTLWRKMKELGIAEK